MLVNTLFDSSLSELHLAHEGKQCVLVSIVINRYWSRGLKKKANLKSRFVQSFYTMRVSPNTLRELGKYLYVKKGKP